MAKAVSKKDNNKNEINMLLLIILVLLFCFTFYITAQYVISYHLNEKEISKNNEVIKINNKYINATIINCGDIKESINKESFNNEEEIIIEKINSVEVAANTKEEQTLKINVKYNILENEFKRNLMATNKSEVLVRFSYSYDNDNWTYINNVISTNSSNISPLIGNNYDIAGLITNLNVATNYEIKLNNENTTKLYWRSETIFKKTNDNEDIKNFKANFTIEYQGNN